jgi:hypothetical protein
MKNNSYSQFLKYGIIMSIIAILFIGGGLVVGSCAQEDNGHQSQRNHHDENYKKEVKTEGRIKIIEDCNCSIDNYAIIEVDDHLYLSNLRGGLIHLESCPCKKNTVNYPIKTDTTKKNNE